MKADIPRSATSQRNAPSHIPDLIWLLDSHLTTATAASLLEGGRPGYENGRENSSLPTST